MSAVLLAPLVHQHYQPLPERAPVGSVWVMNDGTKVVVRADGGVDRVLQGAVPRGRSIASDPVPGRRAER